jgi:RNA polymerase sigma-70 factor (ECF subfamily)
MPGSGFVYMDGRQPCGTQAARLRMYSEDKDLVERILAAEPRAFESLVRKYNRLGGAIAYSIVKDFHLAEDVVQESFLKAFRSLHGLREPEKFKYWFAGLVRSKAVDLLRQRRSRAAAELPECDVGRRGLRQDLAGAAAAPAAASGEEELLREESRARILEAIGDLPEEDRLVVVLKHMEGLSYKEIAELTETSVGAVESRLFRARQALRKKLGAAP